MFLKGSSTENREKGFVTYFQGANKDTSNTTKQSTNFINFKKKSKRWGSPVSMILGRSLISSPTSAVCSLSVSEVLSSDAENSLIDIDSPNSKSSWLSTLWESKSKKSTASVKNQLIVEPTNIEQFRQSDILNDINSSNMTATMTSGFDALMNENIHDQTVDSRVSSGNRSQRPHSNDSSTLRQPASTTVSIHSTVSKCPSEKILVESNAILLNNAHREERLQQRAGKINEVHETLSVLSRSLSNLNEFGILNVTPLSPLSRQINSVTNITLEENLESVPLFTNSATNSDTSIVKRSPCGRTLRLEVFSTWGDEFFVGLTGVEVFDDYGHLISIKPHITDIRLLHPESSNEHSSVWKLVDGMNFTCDDCHSWLVPIDQESKNLYSQAIAIIEIEFTNVIHPSLIRVFNFNKSRTHSFRGVRSCCLKLDETVIFKG